MKKIFHIAFILSLALLLTSCKSNLVSIDISDETSVDSSSSHSSGPFDTIEIDSESFEIGSIEIEYNDLGQILGEQTVVTFKIRNKTGESLSSLACYFDYIDEDGDSVDSDCAGYYGNLGNGRACTVDGVYEGKCPYGISITHIECWTIDGAVGGFYYAEPVVVYFSEQPIYDISHNAPQIVDESSSEIIRGISWNMTKDDVISAEESRPDSSSPYEHGSSLIFLLDSFEYYGAPCEGVIYTCNFTKKNGTFDSYVEEISLDYNESAYEILLLNMTGELGEPLSTEINPLDSDSISYHWEVPNSIISLIYFDGVTHVKFEPTHG